MAILQIAYKVTNSVKISWLARNDKKGKREGGGHVCHPDIRQSFENNFVSVLNV